MTVDEDLKTLGLSGTPSDDDIKSAYRRLARENHPDRGGTAASMADLNEAFARLSSNEHRADDGPQDVQSAPTFVPDQAASAESVDERFPEPPPLHRSLLTFVVLPLIVVVAIMILIAALALS